MRAVDAPEARRFPIPFSSGFFAADWSYIDGK